VEHEEEPLITVVEDDEGSGVLVRRSPHVWWFVGATATVAIVALVLGIILFNSAAPTTARGATTASLAAHRFVAALDAADSRGAAALACNDFADDARSAARSAVDPSFRYTLDAVRTVDAEHATARITEHLKLPVGTRDSSSTVFVLRTSGRWLMCGRSA
jgi:flagellar biosynthesis/type III secretory pathway M-ring protein FliF/YscJ